MSGSQKITSKILVTQITEGWWMKYKQTCKEEERIRWWKHLYIEIFLDKICDKY